MFVQRFADLRRSRWRATTPPSRPAIWSVAAAPPAPPLNHLRRLVGVIACIREADGCLSDPAPTLRRRCRPRRSIMAIHDLRVAHPAALREDDSERALRSSACRYGRSDVNASKKSTTERILTPSGIRSRRSRSGIAVSIPALVVMTRRWGRPETETRSATECRRRYRVQLHRLEFGLGQLVRPVQDVLVDRRICRYRATTPRLRAPAVRVRPVRSAPARAASRSSAPAGCARASPHPWHRPPGQALRWSTGTCELIRVRCATSSCILARSRS